MIIFDFYLYYLYWQNSVDMDNDDDAMCDQ